MPAEDILTALAVLGTWAAVVVALFGERIRLYLARPILVLTPAGRGSSRSSLIANNNRAEIWERLEVFNAGKSTAPNAQAILRVIRFTDPHPDELYGTIPGRYAHQERGSEVAVNYPLKWSRRNNFTADIPAGVAFWLDVAFAVEYAEDQVRRIVIPVNELPWEPLEASSGGADHHGQVLPPGRYEFNILLTADGYKAEERQVFLDLRSHEEREDLNASFSVWRI
jgi:hypothetical protein